LCIDRRFAECEIRIHASRSGNAAASTEAGSEATGHFHQAGITGELMLCALVQRCARAQADRTARRDGFAHVFSFDQARIATLNTYIRIACGLPFFATWWMYAFAICFNQIKIAARYALRDQAGTLVFLAACRMYAYAIRFNQIRIAAWDTH
jgi:hypothetical protein